MDAYDYKTLEAKYDDMTAEKMAAMTAEERGEYYHALYQYFGRMLYIFHNVAPNDGEVDKYPTISAGEYHALSAVYHAHMAMMDGLAGLVEMATEVDDDD